MAIYPGVRLRNIPPGSNDPAIIPIGVILHVDAGNSGSLYGYFDGPSGGIESHFFIRKDGGVEQYRDTSREADANYHANSFIRDGKRYGFISVETQGLAAGEWTAAQLREIKDLLLWAHRTHGIPLRRCPAWDEAGVGYHVMFGAPGPWTPHAKDCPGKDRVKQFDNLLVPWMKTNPTNVPEELSMADAQEILDYLKAVSIQVQKHDDQLVDDTARAVWNYQIADVNTAESGDTSAAATLLTWDARRAAEQAAEQAAALLKPDLDALKETVDALAKAVEALAPKA